MSVLICGSFAYDTIIVFPDRFTEHILPDKIHILNVCFMVPELRREFGGCAGNIAYNLNLLGLECYPMGTVGCDFEPYGQWLRRSGVHIDRIEVIESEYTAQAFITTDLDDNQITAFHVGAMNCSHTKKISTAGIAARLGIISPDGKQGMIEHAAQFADAKIPFMFDPGQQLPLFDEDELRRFIKQATWVTVNEYEWQILQARTDWQSEQILEHVEAFVVTRGSAGSDIYMSGASISIPAAPVSTVKDPTGCGDAYRAGLLYGLSHGLDWATTGRIASLMGAIKIESRGTQNHRIRRSDFEQRYEASFGSRLQIGAA